MMQKIPGEKPGAVKSISYGVGLAVGSIVVVVAVLASLSAVMR